MVNLLNPKQDIMNPIVGGGYRVFNLWIFWVWEFANGWCEWVPAGPFILVSVNYHMEEQNIQRNLPAHADLGLVQTHAMCLHRLLWMIYLGGPSNPDFDENIMDAQLDYVNNVLSKSDWYYESIQGYCHWFAMGVVA